MRAYLMGLFALALCCATVEILSPAGESGGIARHIKLMSGLCLLCVLAVPVTALITDGDSLPERLRQWSEEWLARGEDADDELAKRWGEECQRLDLAVAAETVAEMLEERFSLASSDCRAELELDTEGNIRQIRVVLTGKAIWVNTHEMQDYMESTFGCESVIYIE